MSKSELFAKLIPLVDADPFALLGVSVSADEKKIAKRYRQIAKQLHPDAIAQTTTAQAADQALAVEAIARIVNPSYQKLKHEKGRQEALINLRLRMRRLARTEDLTPTFKSAQQLAQLEGGAVNIFYEQALTQLAQDQFQQLSRSHEQFLEIRSAQFDLFTASSRRPHHPPQTHRADSHASRRQFYGCGRHAEQGNSHHRGRTH